MQVCRYGNQGADEIFKILFDFLEKSVKNRKGQLIWLSAQKFQGRVTQCNIWY